MPKGRAPTSSRNSAKSIRKKTVGSPKLDNLEQLDSLLKTLNGAVAGSPKLFPFGVTKVSITLSGFSIDIEGPQSGAKPFARTALTDASAIVFTITERVGKKARGTLNWPDKGLTATAVSGDSGHDAINVGTWQGLSFQERPGDKPYCDPSGNCWFSVFKDNFGRTDMGIHPDGGTPDATLGCIGIKTGNTSDWHDALKAAGGAITCTVEESLLLFASPDDGLLEVGK